MAVKFTSVLFAVLLVLPLICATSYVHEIIAVDTALDRAASFDYAVGKPDYAASHPFIPYSYRHPMLLLASGISLTVAVVVVVASRSIRLRNRET
jgi:hypothetical protein